MAQSGPNRFELHILGTPDLHAPDGRRVASVLSQPSRLGLLAYLTLAPGPVTRASVTALFWPESNEPRARNALSQALFYLRRSMDKDAVRNVEGDRLWVPPDRVWCDARELLSAERPPDAVLAAAASRPLLEGWNAEASQPLQEWLDTTRRRTRERAEEVLEEARGEPGVAPESGDAIAAPQGPTVGAVPAGGFASPEAGGERSPSRHARRPALKAVAWAAAVLVAALVVVGSALAVVGSRAGPPHLAVLLPRVTPAPAAPGLSALTLNAELLARLPRREGLDVVSLPWAASLQDLMEQRAAIGSSDQDMPDWILDVSVGVTDSAAHVVWVIYSGADRSVFGAASFDEPFDVPGEVVVDVPRDIADRVAAGVAELVR